MRPQEIFIAKYSSGGTASITPYELVITRGRNQTVIPMGPITAIRYTKNSGAWIVVLMCLTIVCIPLIWLPSGSLQIDYEGRGPLSTRLPFNRFRQAEIEEVANRLRFYVAQWQAQRWRVNR
jgi:hypothetical protein